MYKNHIFAPAAFSAIIGLIAFVTHLYTREIGAVSSDSWMPVFFSFLPMCFFMVAGQISQLKSQNDELRREIEAIKSGTAKSAS